MLGAAGFVLALSAFVALAPYYAASIERRLHEETGMALASEALPASGLIVEGRDVLLTGPIASEEARIEAERAVRGVWGVRRVRNFLVVQNTSRPGRRREVQRKIDGLTKAHPIVCSGDGKVAAASLAVLDQVAAVLVRHPEVTLEVKGHAEWLGQNDSSQRLSEKMAASVAGRLLAQGVPAHRIQAAGHGADHPVAPNSTEEGRVRNRRIELQVS